MVTSRDSKLPVKGPQTSDANEIVGVLYEKLNGSLLHPFGSDMLLCDTDSIVATTLAHRVLNKFQVPDQTVAKRLHRECIESWLRFDEELGEFNFDAVSNRSKSVLYRARVLLHDWLKDFKPDMSKIEFTPGETLTSLQGRVSMYQKLRSKAAWTCTHDAFDDFARLVYNTRWLKKCAKEHLNALSRSQHRRLYAAFHKAKHVGYAIFKHRLETEVVTLVHGGRFSSVAKNNTKRRPIIVAPLGNMLLQRCVAHPLRSILSSVGNDLERGQEIHKYRISDPGVATVDFSNASDSNTVKCVSKMFPNCLGRYLSRYRDPFVLVDGCYYAPNKLSSMGCGFTFEVMTMLLLSIARVLDPAATVYGDDVIISNDAAERFIEVMGELRWNVNEKKTFVRSPFRESCGAFYLDGYGYVCCFDLHYMENINDIIVTANKLLLICERNPHVDTGLYREAYEALLRLVPASLVGPVQDGNNPDVGFVMSKNSRRKHMRSTDKTLWKRLAPRALEVADRLNWPRDEIVLCTVPRFVNGLATKTQRAVKDTHRIAWYLSSGGVVKDTIRNEGTWRFAVYVVSPYGRVPIRQFVDEEKFYTRIRSFVGPRQTRF